MSYRPHAVEHVGTLPRYQDTAAGENVDLLKDEAKAKFGRYRAGDHTMAVNSEWSVRLVRQLLQGEVVTECAPPGLLQVKREPRVFN